MRTIALSLLIVLGVVLVACGVVLIATALRERKHAAHRYLTLVVGYAVFFLVTGALCLLAAAVPSTRDWAILTLAALLIAQGVVFSIVKRVVKDLD